MTSVGQLCPRTRVALEIAADAALQGRELCSVQLDALLEAAPYAQSSVVRLESTVAMRGACTGRNTEDWYPPYAEDGDVNEAVRATERAQAAALCEECPVRGQCLALAWMIGSPGVWGVWGGLPPRDRLAVRLLWIKLLARLVAYDGAELDLCTELSAGDLAVAS